MKMNCGKQIVTIATLLMAAQLTVSAQSVRAISGTGKPGTKAKVTATKSGDTTVFKFLIPRGNPGAPGVAGPQGPKGDKGDSAPASSTPVFSQGTNNQPPDVNTEFIDFGNGISLARDGTVDGLILLTTKKTTSKLVVTATGVDLTNPHPGPFNPFTWANYVSIPKNTLASQSFPIVLPNNTVSVRLIAGDPANKGTHTVIELHRDSADLNGSYIGTISIQDAQ